MKNRLIKLVDDRFKSQSAFARSLHVTRQTVSNMISKEMISVEMILKIKELVPDLNLNWLLLGEGPQYNKDYDGIRPNIMNEPDGMYSTKSELEAELRLHVEHLREHILFLQKQIEHIQSRQRQAGQP